MHEVVPLADLSREGARIVATSSRTAPRPSPRRRRGSCARRWSDLDEAASTALIESHAAKRQSAEAGEGLASFAESARRGGERADERLPRSFGRLAGIGLSCLLDVPGAPAKERGAVLIEEPESFPPPGRTARAGSRPDACPGTVLSC